MDTKVKHRLLGLVVIVSAVVILLPFFQSRLSPTPEPEIAIKKAPPFPEQTVQVARVDMPRLPEAPAAAPAVEKQPEQPTVQVAANEVAAPVPATAAAPEVAPQPEPVSTPVSMTVAAAADAAIAHAKQTAHATTKLAKARTLPAVAHAKPYPPLHVTTDKNGLFKLQQTAWLVQVGHFKSHPQALRLANQLRAKGYQALVQHYGSAKGTDLFVKADNNRKAALALSSELQKKMHLQGVVIRYQPV
jgi:cell division septation protein DedD